MISIHFPPAAFSALPLLSIHPHYRRKMQFLNSGKHDQRPSFLMLVIFLAQLWDNTDSVQSQRIYWTRLSALHDCCLINGKAGPLSTLKPRQESPIRRTLEHASVPEISRCGLMSTIPADGFEATCTGGGLHLMRVSPVPGHRIIYTWPRRFLL